MKRLSVVELKNSLGEVLNKAEYQGEMIIVQRRGKDSAAIIPIEDLKLLERLREEEEDRIDVAAALVALADPGERITLEEFRRRERLEDEPSPKKRTRTRARTKAL